MITRVLYDIACVTAGVCLAGAAMFLVRAAAGDADGQVFYVMSARMVGFAMGAAAFALYFNGRLTFQKG